MNNRFIQAMNTQSNETVTQNGMKIQKSSQSFIVDLFFAIGASRGSDITPLFNKARMEDLDLAVRVALYARDARQGMGERQHFRNIVRELARTDPTNAKRVIAKVPELGRYDDLLAFVDTPLEKAALEVFANAILEGNGLAAKWAPREKSAKKKEAAKLRKVMGLTPRQYRRILAKATDVVEQDMCSDNWDAINYSHVPSVAAARYQRAFSKHDAIRYNEYLSSLERGDADVKINADAVYPYTVVSAMYRGNSRAAEQQWKALPDWIPNDRSFLPLIDVSASMTWHNITPSVTPMDVAISLGLYCSQRAKGAFKDTFLTFTSNPTWQDVSGLSLRNALDKIRHSEWGGSTNLEGAFSTILNVAKRYDVPASDMPEFILIMSDMQFNQAVERSNSMYSNIEEAYAQAGYEMPKVVFWNLQDYGRNTPVDFTQDGTALVSGFSPALMQSVLAFDVESFTPLNVVKQAVMKPRYDW